MRRVPLSATLVVLSITALPARPARGQASPAPTPPGWGRLSLFLQGGQSRPDDGSPSLSSSNAIGTFTYRSAPNDEGGVEYGVDTRGSTYSAGEVRQSRFTLYDAYVGGRTRGGTLGVRVGQMWLTELGALGSVGGVLLEYRPRVSWKAGKLRFGLFGGLEPTSYEAGYVSGVKKGGAYAVLEGEGARRHVLGFVTIRNAGLTERSVVSMTNFVPAGKTVFIYQAAELDLVGPGGIGSGGLTYFFVNARWAVSNRVEVQGLYHRGRSIDTRTITQDMLDGRPVDPRLLAGYLFSSIGGRVSVEVAQGVRLYGGYARDTNNQDEASYGRLTAGLYVADLFKSGVDLTVSDNRMDRLSGSYDSWYASIGRSLGSRVYLSLDAGTALSVMRVSSTGGITIETRPRTRRASLNGNFNVSRSVSLLLTLEETRDDTSRDDRGMLGFSFRF